MSALDSVIEKLARQVLASEPTFRPGMGRWEADVEAYNLLLLAARHGLSVAMLLAQQKELYTSATVLSRACMEAGAKAIWLVQPDDPYERECRWLAHLAGEINTRKRLGDVMPSELKVAEQIAEFRDGVAAALPDGYIVPKGVPKVKNLLEIIDLPEKYLLYINSSQYSHGTHYAGGAFRTGLGTQKLLTNVVRDVDCFLPLATCWHFVALPALRLCDIYGVDTEIVVPQSLQQDYVSALNRTQ